MTKSQVNQRTPAKIHSIWPKASLNERVIQVINDKWIEHALSRQANSLSENLSTEGKVGGKEERIQSAQSAVN